MEKILFEPTEKQDEFIRDVFNPDNVFIAYGGAAGGGKTIGSLATIILLCKLYKNSRYAVIRKSLTEIRLNTIPSFWKVCPKNFLQSFNKTEYHAVFTNGSEILFRGENIDADPELQWMDGLEVNGFLLEQAEELDRKTYDKCKLRAGRWVINPMPPIKILLTLNPSMSWTKKEIYEPYIKGDLKSPYKYIPAKITDNKHLPDQYIKNLQYLDQITYKRFVDGDWNAFAVNKPYAYCFTEDRNVSHEIIPYDDNAELMLSFDFNLDPITCIASQYINDEIRIIKEFRLENSNIYEMCDVINAAFINPLIIITGDATGRASSALTRGNLNYYKIIKERLQLLDTQIKTPTVNPAISDGRVLVNSILQHFKVKINPECKYLIEDLQLVEVDEFGKIDKAKDKHRTHLLDCFIYLLNTFYKHLLKNPIFEIENNINPFENENDELPYYNPTDDSIR